MCLSRDMRTIHKWVNLDYAKRFWQMDYTYGKLYKHYEAFLDRRVGGSLTFFMDNRKRPLALMDFYQVIVDEIGSFYEAGPEDVGIHFLMAPIKKKVPGLSRNVLLTGLSYLFSLGVERIVGEPDARNEKANQLVTSVGFTFIKEIQMSYKRAHLYLYERNDFLKDHPSS